MKRILLAVGSLAMVALLGVTMVDRSVDAQDPATLTVQGASTADSSDKESRRDAYLAALAEKLGVSTEQLQTAVDATNEELGLGGLREWRRSGVGSRWNFPRGEGRGHLGRTVRWIDLTPAADFLGMTEDELRDELQSGNRFLEIAAEHGKTTEDVRAFLIQQATVAIDDFLQDTEVAPATTPAATTTA